MKQRFYYWKLKDRKEGWIAYSVAHNLKEVRIVEASIKRLKDRFDFRCEEALAQGDKE